MTRETLEWLNNNVLVGFKSDRQKWTDNGWSKTRDDGYGNTEMVPWFARDGYDGAFDGPVPVEAVNERLFNWDAVSAPMQCTIPTTIDAATGIDTDGNPVATIDMPEHQAIVRNDTNEVMGVFKSGYRIHQYSQWLLDNVANLVDGELQIDSAGLIRGGGVAWVSVSLPESICAVEGFAVRPRLLNFTSHTGQFATTYMRSVGIPVCDNSFMSEVKGGAKDGAEAVRVKHSSRSLKNLSSARDALGIVYQQTEEMTRFFEQLADWDVTDKLFKAVMDEITPIPAPVVKGGKVQNKRAITLAEGRQEELATMYVSDHRAAPWRGTALGVVQAFNTWDQQVRGASETRLERQMLATLSGDVAGFDAKVLNTLTGVCVEAGQSVPELVCA